MLFGKADRIEGGKNEEDNKESSGLLEVLGWNDSAVWIDGLQHSDDWGADA